MTFVAGFYSFNLSITIPEREVYETTRIKIARHPDESLIYLFGRVIAFCHSYTLGLEFSRGIFEIKEPTLWQHDFSGRLLQWVQLGNPEGDKLERALRRAPDAHFQIYFYERSQIDSFCHRLRGSTTNWVESIEFYEIPSVLLMTLAEDARSSSTLAFTAMDHTLYLTFNGREIESSMNPVDIWQEFQRTLQQSA